VQKFYHAEKAVRERVSGQSNRLRLPVDGWSRGYGRMGPGCRSCFLQICFLQIMRLEIQGFSEATYAAMATMSSIVSLATTARMRLLAAPEREPC